MLSIMINAPTWTSDPSVLMSLLALGAAAATVVVREAVALLERIVFPR